MFQLYFECEWNIIVPCGEVQLCKVLLRHTCLSTLKDHSVSPAASLQVILSELYSTGFQRSFSDDDDLTTIADSDVIYAFQAPPLYSRGSNTSHSGNHWNNTNCYALWFSRLQLSSVLLMNWNLLWLTLELFILSVTPYVLLTAVVDCSGTVSAMSFILYLSLS